MDNAYSVSWSEIEQRVAELAAKVCRTRWDILLGVPRGGIIVAGMLSYHLPGSRPIGSTTSSNPPASFNVLILDDIIDSGKTIKEVSARFRYSKCASLYLREQCKVTPNYWASIVMKGIWLRFPWEVEDGRQRTGTKV
jgi:hypoxanthine phosphoribosyltransferase